MQVQIERAQPADADEILRIHGDAVRAVEPGHYEPAVIAAWAGIHSPRRVAKIAEVIGKGDEIYLVARQEGRLVGFGSVHGTSGKIGLLYVDPMVWRQGVGSALMEGLVRIAREKNLKELTLDSSLNAETFYRRHGFEVIGRGIFHLPGVDAANVCMKRVLTQDIDARQRECIRLAARSGPGK